MYTIRFVRRVLVAMMVVSVTMLATTAFADSGGRTLATMLTGAQEVPVLGDLDGAGMATVRVNPGQGQLCYDLSVSGIDPAIAAHLHIAPAGEAGPVVVPLTAPTSGSSSGCVDIGRSVAINIIQNPELYYVNVHN